MDCFPVGDVTSDETVARITGETGQIGEVAGIGQAVEIDDVYFGMRFEQVLNEVTADEPTAAGYHDGRHSWPFLLVNADGAHSWQC